LNLHETTNIIELSSDISQEKSKDDIDVEIKKLIKICSKCGLEKEHILFKKNICKQCMKIIHHDYYLKNRTKISEEKKIKYIENKDNIALDRKLFYKNNREKILARGKKYREKNIIRYTEYAAKYRKVNLHNIVRKNSIYKRKRRLFDPVYKLRENCSRLINRAMHGSKNGQSILKYFDYSMEELKHHLEKQFDENMSWDNYGSYWHIIPQSKLLYTCMEDDNFKKCWSLENLRPLEKIANIRKGNKLEGKVL
jgi:hypothetical protein